MNINLTEKEINYTKEYVENELRGIYSSLKDWSKDENVEMSVTGYPLYKTMSPDKMIVKSLDYNRGSNGLQWHQDLVMVNYDEVFVPNEVDALCFEGLIPTVGVVEDISTILSLMNVFQIRTFETTKNLILNDKKKLIDNLISPTKLKEITKLAYNCYQYQSVLHKKYILLDSLGDVYFKFKVSL